MNGEHPQDEADASQPDRNPADPRHPNQLNDKASDKSHPRPYGKQHRVRTASNLPIELDPSKNAYLSLPDPTFRFRDLTQRQEHLRGICGSRQLLNVATIRRSGAGQEPPEKSDPRPRDNGDYRQKIRETHLTHIYPFLAPCYDSP